MIPIKKGITGTDIPNIAVETSDSTIPRKPILVEGEPAPEPITVTALTVTENGTYPAPEGSAYSPVTVNVSPVEPDTKIISEFDFSQAEYDLIRSMPSDDPLLSAILKGYTYNASYDSVNGVISWINGYGSWSPDCYLQPFKNYDIEVDMGAFDTTSQLAGTKQIIGLSKDGTNGLRFCWNVSNGYFQIINDSGTVNLPTLTDLSIISNAKILIKTRWSISTINYDPVCNVTIILNRDDPVSPEISFGRIDRDYAYELRVGRITSQNGIFPYSIKKCKVTEYKWNPSSINLLLKSNNRPILEGILESEVE